MLLFTDESTATCEKLRKNPEEARRERRHTHARARAHTHTQARTHTHIHNTRTHTLVVLHVDEEHGHVHHMREVRPALLEDRLDVLNHCPRLRLDVKLERACVRVSVCVCVSMVSAKGPTTVRCMCVYVFQS